MNYNNEKKQRFRNKQSKGKLLFVLCLLIALVFFFVLLFRTLNPEVKVNSEDSNFIQVESYRRFGMTDDQVIQAAFDNADGKVVEFESGREYNLKAAVIADAAKVRGIEGNNSLLRGTEEAYTLEMIGSREWMVASADLIEDILETEMSNYIRNIRITSNKKYAGDGIHIRRLFSPTIENVTVYNTRNGITFTGQSNNIILANNNIFNNIQTGLFFNQTSIHQGNFTGNHISYSENVIRFVDSDIANFQFTGNDIENAMLDRGRVHPESIISFESTEKDSSLYEAIVVTGNTIQEHTGNNEPLINVDVYEDEAHDIIIDSNLIGNTSSRAPSVYLTGTNGVSISNNSIVGFPEASGGEAIVLEGVNTNIRVFNNHLVAPIDYSDADITNMIISNNLLEDFTMPDFSDDNIRISGNGIIMTEN